MYASGSYYYYATLSKSLRKTTNPGFNQDQVKISFDTLFFSQCLFFLKSAYRGWMSLPLPFWPLGRELQFSSQGPRSLHRSIDRHRNSSSLFQNIQFFFAWSNYKWTVNFLDDEYLMHIKRHVHFYPQGMYNPQIISSWNS